MNDFAAWAIGCLLIASAFVALSILPRVMRAWREGERGTFLWLLISIELHAIGVLLAALGQMTGSIFVLGLGLSTLLVSKEVWQMIGGRKAFIAQLAAIAAWTVWILARGL